MASGGGVSPPRTLPPDYSDPAEECARLKVELRFLGERAATEQQRLQLELHNTTGRLERLAAERAQHSAALEQLAVDAGAHRQAAEVAERARVAGEVEAATLRDQLRIVAEERDRIDRQAELFQQTARKSLGDLEQELERQVRTAQAREREVTEKEMEMREAKKEVALMREHLESVARELVERQPEQDRERQKAEAQLEAAKRSNEELVEEILGLGQHAKGLEEQLLTARRELTVVKEEAANLREELRRVNDASGQVEREIRAKAANLSSCSEALREAREDAEDKARDLAMALSERASFAASVLRAVETVAEAVRRLWEETEGCRSALHQRLALSLRPDEARGEVDLRRVEVLERARRRQIAHQGGSDERVTSGLLMQVADELSTVWEDTRVVRSDLEELLRSHIEMKRQVESAERSYMEGRERVESLTLSLEQANETCVRLASEKRELEEAHSRHDEWMQEAVRISRQRDVHRDALVAELEDLRRAVDGAEMRRDMAQRSNEDLERRLGEAERRRVQTGADLVAERERAAHGADELGRLRSENAQLRARCSEFARERDSLRARLEELDRRGHSRDAEASRGMVGYGSATSTAPPLVSSRHASPRVQRWDRAGSGSGGHQQDRSRRQVSQSRRLEEVERQLAQITNTFAPPTLPPNPSPTPPTPASHGHPPWAGGAGSSWPPQTTTTGAHALRVA
eukprot:Hpha_TRINITY_DN16472_c0_g1::TRINITY_DN16472_c0_g1_i1::g.160598::m.160598